MKIVKTEEEQELLDCLMDVVEQACGSWIGNDTELDSSALSSYAYAMRLLADYGLIKIKSEYGRRVIGEVVNKISQSGTKVRL